MCQDDWGPVNFASISMVHWTLFEGWLVLRTKIHESLKVGQEKKSLTHEEKMFASSRPDSDYRSPSLLVFVTRVLFSLIFL